TGHKFFAGCETLNGSPEPADCFADLIRRGHTKTQTCLMPRHWTVAAVYVAELAWHIQYALTQRRTHQRTARSGLHARWQREPNIQTASGVRPAPLRPVLEFLGERP